MPTWITSIAAAILVTILITLATLALLFENPIKSFFVPLRDNGDGTIYQRSSKKLWIKCSEGLSGQKCIDGKALSFTWAEAQEKAKSIKLTEEFECRLPTKEELLSIVDDDTENAKIKEKFFPNTIPWFYWSKTTDQSSDNMAWNINFADGRASNHSKQEKAHIRIICEKMSYSTQ